jgi:hypothetical protein
LQPTATTRPTDGAIPASRLKAKAESEQPAASLQQQTVAGPVAAAAPPAERVLAAGGRARVANTDGMGVVFYSAPRVNARMPAGLLEGTSVTVLETAEGEWARVQSDSKKAGWVRSAYLVPAE